MKRYIILTIIFISLLWLFAPSAQGQRWKRTRWDVQFGLGTTQFFGDLGGGAEDAAHFFGVRDLDISSTRPLIHVGAQ